MLDDARSLKEIKEDIKIISGNKLSMSQSKLLFMALSFEMILRKDLFPKKSNLKVFIENVYEKCFDNGNFFKDYLYSSRTILAARLEKKIQTELAYQDILKIVGELYKILPSDEIKIKNKKNNTSLEIVEWMNFIENKEEN